MNDDAGGASASNDGLGPLPEPAYPDCYEIPRTGGATCSGYSSEQMEQYAAAAVAAERERWRAKLMAHRDRTVMSRYARLSECEAARNAIQRVLDDVA